jgi:diaminopimelate epimerase
MSATVLRFEKYEGAGNDFVVLDDRGSAFPRGEACGSLVRELCDRRRGVGADGVLLLRRPERVGQDFTMAYFNADGGEAEMCGNGARCLARFAREFGAAGDRMAFQTCAGPYRAEVRGDKVAVAFPDIAGEPQPMELEASGRTWDCTFLEAGVPHLVVWLPEVASARVAEWGPGLRRHPRVGPRGANVNFAAAIEGGLALRTFERGVEGETLACGTGAVATALCHAARRGSMPVVDLNLWPTSGDLLRVEGRRVPGGGFADVWLTGPARRVFRGEWPVQPAGLPPGAGVPP